MQQCLGVVLLKGFCRSMHDRARIKKEEVKKKEKSTNMRGDCQTSFSHHDEGKTSWPNSIGWVGTSYDTDNGQNCSEPATVPRCPNLQILARGWTQRPKTSDRLIRVLRWISTIHEYRNGQKQRHRSLHIVLITAHKTNHKIA